MLLRATYCMSTCATMTQMASWPRRHTDYRQTLAHRAHLLSRLMMLRTSVGCVLGPQGLLDPAQRRALKIALRAGPDQHLLHHTICLKRSRRLSSISSAQTADQPSRSRADPMLRVAAVAGYTYRRYALSST